MSNMLHYWPIPPNKPPGTGGMAENSARHDHDVKRFLGISSSLLFRSRSTSTTSTWIQWESWSSLCQVSRSLMWVHITIWRTSHCLTSYCIISPLLQDNIICQEAAIGGYGIQTGELGVGCIHYKSPQNSWTETEQKCSVMKILWTTWKFCWNHCWSSTVAYWTGWAETWKWMHCTLGKECKRPWWSPICSFNRCWWRPWIHWNNGGS
jgi:hypothetical protein